MNVEDIYQSILQELKSCALSSAYKQDADERDPKYKSYGVRIPQVREIIKNHKPEILRLSHEDRLELAQKLVFSEMGEEQTIAFFVLESISAYFTPDKFHFLDQFISHMFGWSKIDGFCGGFLQRVLEKYPEQVIALVKKWNTSNNVWEKRASVVLFTRKIAKSGKYNDLALSLCANLVHDNHDLVRKGVGWSLKDMMRSDKQKITDYIKDLRKQKVSSVITLYAMKDLSSEERKEILNQKDE
jgi:3-methyladenine DNA glycosylase AlkD